MAGAGKGQVHSIAGTFVFLLLSLFAALACVLVLFGVRAYRTAAGEAKRHNEARILSAYVRSLVRSEDAADVATEEPVGGVDCVTLTQVYDGRTYLTRVYSYDGSLRVWFSEADRDFDPASGEAVCACAGFTPVIAEGLLTLQMLPAEGEEPLEVSVMLYAGGEAA